jgi:hypothetical protein
MRRARLRTPHSASLQIVATTAITVTVGVYRRDLGRRPAYRRGRARLACRRDLGRRRNLMRRNGGRSSRKLGSKLNDLSAGYPINRVSQVNDTLLRCIIFTGRRSAVGQNEPSKHVRSGGSFVRKRPWRSFPKFARVL